MNGLMMKSRESPDVPEGKKADPKSQELPQVYAINRSASGWTLSRRSLLSAAAAAVAVVAAPRRAHAGSLHRGRLRAQRAC